MRTDEIGKVGLYLATSWQSYRPNEATPLVLERNLGDLEFAVVVRAIDQLATEHPQFAPNPQTIRARALELLRGPEPSKGDAWGELMREIGRVGWVGTPYFEDARVYAIVEQLGGWRHICETFMVDDEMANRAHFFKLYDDVAARMRREGMMTPEDRSAIEEARTRFQQNALGRGDGAEPK